MNRLFYLFLLFLIFTLCTCQETKEQLPNVVLIVVDDLGSADLGCFGSQSINTPHLDQLAKSGVKFTQAYSGNTVCAPARSTLMTGLHSGHTPVRGNTGGIALPDETVTMAELFKNAGYATGGFGKWGLGEIGTTGVPEKQGFDHFFGYYHQIHAHDYYPKYLWHNSQKVVLNASEEKSVYSTYRIFDELKKFVADHQSQPFFCYAPWTAPHNKYIIPETDPNFTQYQTEDWTTERKNYAGMVSLLDQHVGELVALLTSLQLLENTLIVFCSDNGGDQIFKEYATNGDLRGFKRDLYEGGIRVPMMASWRGKLPAGTELNHLVYFPDLLPTLIEAAGIHDPTLKVDGRSFYRHLLDSKRPWKDRFLYWEYPDYDWGNKEYLPTEFKQALRYRQWKMIRNGQNAEWEFYDLNNDPKETDNVAAYHPGKMQKFQEWIAKNRVEAIEQKEPERIGGKTYR